MKFNLDNLEQKLNNISNFSQNIHKKINSKKNKEQIIVIIKIFLTVYEYDYNIEKKHYLETISTLSPVYLLGSEWYIGENYTHEHFYNSLNNTIKYKIFMFLFIMNSLYNMY
tara:strand:- start:261 stop:596 length:336 start_codon:yes stop_codon:yes gene_type:complete